MPYQNESDVATVTLQALCDRFGISRSTLQRLLKRAQIAVIQDSESVQAAIAARDVARVREARQRALKHMWKGRQYYLPPD